ncbi:para-nitrobenzyl esterase-like [Brevipalpus obovatus]|uniref:para-nitrobenzyl esterase-like n=1 Tax=Brevipalpus obovatus TaxID=246614 RepID=UPI003D9F2206
MFGLFPIIMNLFSRMYTSAILCGLILLFVRSSLAGDKVVKTPVVKTRTGPIVGMVQNKVGEDLNYFFGIPYAEPPVGELRFQRPRPVTTWTDVLEATELAPRCLQPRRSLQYVREKSSEDCLYLNIVTPKDSLSGKNPKYPVMISILHKNYIEGSGNDEIYLKSEFVKRQNIILVTLNSRLNIFGYATTREKDGIELNCGLWDENFAIRWVNSNIEFFGGDPNKITLRGQGSGAANVRAHVLSPYARDIFQNAIVEDQAFEVEGEQRLERVSNSTMITLERIGCAPLKNRLECVQDKDALQIASSVPFHWSAFAPVYEPNYIPKAKSDEEQIAQANDVNLLQGFATDYSSFPVSFNQEVYVKAEFTYQDALEVLEKYVEPGKVGKIAEIFIGDPRKAYSIQKLQKGLVRFLNEVGPVVLYYESLLTAEAENKKKGVYTYEFNHIPQSNDYQACDVVRELGVCFRAAQSFVFGEPYSNYWYHTDEDRKMSDIMMHIYGSFIRTGKPELLNGKGWPNWNDPKSKKANVATVILDAKSGGIIDRSNPDFYLDNFDLVRNSLLPKFHPYDPNVIDVQLQVNRRSSNTGFLYRAIQALAYVDY